MEAHSEGVGNGATFIVNLPISASMPGRVRQNPPPAATERPRDDIPPPSLLGTKVLVVDDDADARELLRSILVRSGASVRTAGSAAEALQQFEARQPDVLVSDIGMPGRDGYDLIRHIRLRSTESGGHVPASHSRPLRVRTTGGAPSAPASTCTWPSLSNPAELVTVVSEPRAPLRIATLPYAFTSKRQKGSLPGCLAPKAARH